MTVYCDVDGTLLDSSARHERLLRDLLKETGIAWPVHAPDYLNYKADGHTTRSWLEAVGISRSKAEKIAAAWQARIETEPYLAMDHSYEDAVAFLRALHEWQAKVVLLSARQDAGALRTTLQRCALLPLADEVVVVSPRRAVDEKAAVLRARAERGDVMVGDTEADLEAAQCVGVRCLVLDRGFRSRNYWKRRGIPSLENLQAVFAAIVGPGKEE